VAAAPWDPDRPPLTAREVSHLVGDAFPDLRGEPVGFAGNGYDHDVYRVGRVWAFRFPRREEVQARLGREKRVLDAVAGTGTIGLRLPVLERWADPIGEFPYAFAGFRFIEGLTGDDGPVDVMTTGTILGRALRRLHAVEPPADVPDDHRTPCEQLERFRSSATLVESCLAPEVWSHWHRHAAGAVSVPPEHASSPVLLHNDLTPSHVIFEGRVPIGLIDFTDAARGDPAQDFVGFYYYLGEHFLQPALRAYASPDRGLAERIRFLAHVLAPTWLAEAVEHAERPNVNDEAGDDIAEHVKDLKTYARRRARA
jgi:aminoglycoside phosphotransferase (APT) family kinase protein